MTCRWFLSDHLSPDAERCGKPTIGDHSYCEEHRAIIRKKREPRKPKTNRTRSSFLALKAGMFT